MARINFILTVLMAFALSTPAFCLMLPGDPKDMKRPILFEEMEAHLLKLDAAHDFIAITKEGESVEGRAIYLVRIAHAQVAANPWKVLAIGAQHGNEHSGKDALIFMIDEIARNPKLLPDDTELYVIPMANPDGVNKDQRRNGNNEDLNRDHTLLLQPETQAIHRVQQRVRAHLTVDCHEFTRDGDYFLDKGWKKWPLVTMGTVNNPYVDRRVVEFSEEKLATAQRLFDQEGIFFMEYLLGGPPPDVELRPSTPEADDARNGLGLYGNLSFIIEAGIFRGNPEPQADFGPRVAAYRTLLWHLIKEGNRSAAQQAVEQARTSASPGHLPVNYFWGNTEREGAPFLYPALDAATGEKQTIPTANLMNELIIKKFVSRPEAYLIPAEHAEVYAPLLERHALAFRQTTEPTTLRAESIKLLRIEKETDPVYERYGGRQVTESLGVSDITLGTGSLIIPTEGIEGRRAALLLEPQKIYGLYQYEAFLDTVSPDGLIPVYRQVR